MKFNLFIVFYFIICMLTSSVALAYIGQIEENSSHAINSSHIVTAATHVDGDSLHHIVDKHHDGHDCHMAAHFIALSSDLFALAYFRGTQILPIVNSHFFTHRTSPLNKPPRN